MPSWRTFRACPSLCLPFPCSCCYFHFRKSNQNERWPWGSLMQGGRQEREHCHLGLGRAWQPYPARRHHQANQRVGPVHWDWQEEHSIWWLVADITLPTPKYEHLTVVICSRGSIFFIWVLCDFCVAMHPYGKAAWPYTLEEEGICRRLESE